MSPPGLLDWASSLQYRITMHNRLLSIPVLFYKRFGIMSVIPFFLISSIAVFFLRGIEIKPDISLTLPATDPYLIRKEQITGYFAPSDFIVIAVEKKDASAYDVYDLIQRLSLKLQGIEGIDSVFSMTTVKDIRGGEEGALEFVPFIDNLDEDTPPAELVSVIKTHALFAKFFISRDGQAFSIYVFPEDTTIDRELIPRIIDSITEVSGNDNGTRIEVFGERILLFYVHQNTAKDFIYLGVLALIVVFIIEIVVTRSLLYAVILWISSLLPAVWCLSLFPVFHLQMDVTTIMVPIIVLALSTSYGIHLFRFYSLDASQNMFETLKGVTPIILYAAVTTIVGFSSLLVSRLKELKIFGAFLMIGIFFALLLALFLLPSLVALVQKRLKRQNHLLRIPSLWKRRNFFYQSVLSLAVLMVCAAIGITFIEHNYLYYRLFRPRSIITRSIAYFDKRFGGLDELALIIDSGKEYGLVDAGFFTGVKNLSNKLSEESMVLQTYSYVDFVEWIDERISGQETGLRAVTEEAIGESLELLSSGESVLGIDTLVDAAYSRAKVLIRFQSQSTSGLAPSEVLTSLKVRITRIMETYFPGIGFDIIGAPIDNEQLHMYIVKGQRDGILLFFPILFAFLLYLFKSFKWALIAVLPTLLGVFFFLGAMGWLNIPLDPPIAISLAAVLGVSVDDVIYFLVFLKQQLKSAPPLEALALTLQKAGVGIFHTTIIIVVGVGVLLFSTMLSVVYSGLLTGVTLSFCTLVTLIVVPAAVRTLIYPNISE